MSGIRTTKSSITLLEFLNDVIMLMKAGNSFENALEQVGNSDFVFGNDVVAPTFTKNDAQKSQFCSKTVTKIGSVVSRCRKKSSQSIRILEVYKEIEVLRQRLRSKQHAITLQAKAQAIVIGIIYVLLFVLQWFLNPQFSTFLVTRVGFLVGVASFTSVSVGIWLVFRIGNSFPKEV